LPPARDAPEERGARTRGGLSGDPGKEGAACPFPVLVTRLPGPEGRTGVLPPYEEPPEPSSSGGAFGGRNVVIRRVLPTGKGERPSSQTPELEDVNRGRGRSPGIRPGKSPTNEDPHDRSPIHLGRMETGPAPDSVSVREEGEGPRRVRKAFVRRQRRKREPEGGPTGDGLVPTTEGPPEEDLTPHRIDHRGGGATWFRTPRGRTGMGERTGKTDLDQDPMKPHGVRFRGVTT